MTGTKHRRRAAIHEAGHAVAHHVLGHQFTVARIYEAPHRSVAGVSCLGEVEHDPDLVYPAVEIAISSMSGPIAESRHMKQALVAALLGGGQSDLQSARIALAESRFTFDAAERWARDLVTKNWPAI